MWKGRIPRAGQEHRRTIALDLLVWVLLAATVLTGDALGSVRQPGWLTVAGLGGLALALPLARRWPVAGWLL
ncbi:hypothetical protein, partial [Streptomyces oceani]|uniref:hypothetical protein n=1 Tax=Streptomyces oceani TaxID=1075402 RepID=UPI001BAE5A31